MASNPWDRIDGKDGESDEAWMAFQEYRGLGPGRSLKKLVIAQGIKRGSKGDQKGIRIPQHVRSWCTKFQWVKRAEAYDARNDKIADKAVEKVVAEKAKSRAQQALETLDRNDGHLDQIYLRVAKQAATNLEKQGIGPTDAKVWLEVFARAMSLSREANTRWLPTPEAAQSVMTTTPDTDLDDIDISDETVEQIMALASADALKKSAKAKEARTD